MKWFKLEPEEEEIVEPEAPTTLVYLGPEALKHAIIIDDFATFQDSSECIPGGRLFEVSRQYSYRLRQVADLVEEPLEDHKLQINSKSKRNFQSELRPEKRFSNNNEPKASSDQDSSLIELKKDSEEEPQPLQKVRPEQVPFKDLESLFVK